MFTDRTNAGERLGRVLRERGTTADVVLAIPRGGLPVGRAVADALSTPDHPVPLDVVVARKLGAPGNPELAVGAVGADGAVWLNDALVERLGVSEGYLERERDRQEAAVREKLTRYRAGRPPLDLAGKTVLVVDDGVATGATAIACLRTVREAGADRVVLAVPVASPDTVDRLRSVGDQGPTASGASHRPVADEVIAVETPPYFGAVGQYYRSFAQVGDAEARTYLDRSPD
ncbi:phosphoribosyltransferase [Halomarina rubra]|uniref:Phosphoribosyltransferase n=1 Tax=Halomarina rubra TaxID=2071873 RepID=A0ABD6AQL2_9EURY|nr:phosphoribosyltransferase family protein [Halomarina rubra]